MKEKMVCNVPQKICNPLVRGKKTPLSYSFSKRAINTFKEMDKKNMVIYVRQPCTFTINYRLSSHANVQVIFRIRTTRNNADFKRCAMAMMS